MSREGAPLDPIRNKFILYAALSITIIPLPVSFLIVDAPYWKMKGIDFRSEKNLAFKSGTCLKVQSGLDSPTFLKVESYEKGNWKMKISVLSEGQGEVNLDTKKAERLLNDLDVERLNCDFVVLDKSEKTALLF